MLRQVWVCAHSHGVDKMTQQTSMAWIFGEGPLCYGVHLHTKWVVGLNRQVTELSPLRSPLYFLYFFWI